MLEYAHGSNPRGADSRTGLRLGQHVVKVKQVGSASAKPYDMEVVNQRSKYAQDAQLILETSGDLREWRRDGYHVVETIVTDSEDGLTQTVRARIRVKGGSSGFARLRLDQE